MIRLCSIVVLFVVLAVLGCRAVEMEQTIDVRITSESFSVLTGRDWGLQQMTIDGTPYPLTGRMPTVQFEQEGRVHGFASVNRFFGSLAIDPQGQVTWSDGFGSTKMAGSPDAMEQEKAFMNALLATEFLNRDRDTLFAYAMDGQTVLVFIVQ